MAISDERDRVVTSSGQRGGGAPAAPAASPGEPAGWPDEGALPEVVVLDLRMPGLDGMEVLRRITRDHPGVEVIIVTGHGGEEEEALARELGACDFLKKPVDVNVLAERIRAATARARRVR